MVEEEFKHPQQGKGVGPVTQRRKDVVPATDTVKGIGPAIAVLGERLIFQVMETM